VLLLDTNAAIYLAHGLPIREAAVEAIELAAAEGGLFISPVSAWEVGLLVRKRRLDLTLAPLDWFGCLLRRSGARLAPLSPAAAIASSFLPGPFHADPADRLLIATARELDLALVTRDARILAYAEAGQMRAMAC
jgi:PIN domain nuclease of toxin-antitoxin system